MSIVRFRITPTPSNTATNTPTITPTQTNCPVSSTPTITPTNTLTPTTTPQQNTLWAGITSILCDNSSLSGASFGITYNGNVYVPNSLSFGDTTLVKCPPVNYPTIVSGLTMSFSLTTLDPNFELCPVNISGNSTTFDRIDIEVGSPSGVLVWNGTLKYYLSGVLQFTYPTAYTLDQQNAPYNEYGCIVNTKVALDLIIGDGVFFYVRQKITPTITPTNTLTPTRTPTLTPTNTIGLTPSITPTNTATPSLTPTQTITPTCGTFTTQYMQSAQQGNKDIRFTLFDNPDFTGNANAVCDYTITGTFDIDGGAINQPYTTIMAQNDHNHTYDTGSNITGFTITSVVPVCPCVLVIFNQITPTPTLTPTNTPTITQTSTPTGTIVVSPTMTSTPTITPTITPTNTNTPSSTSLGCQQIFLYPDNTNPCDHLNTQTLYDTDSSLSPTILYVSGGCGSTPVVGNFKWFSQGTLATSYQVDNSGVIINTFSCP
jgi:hypothetical protein